MRKFISALLVTGVSLAGMPLSAMALSGESITVTGTAYSTTLQPLSGANLQIRTCSDRERNRAKFAAFVLFVFRVIAQDILL